MRAVDELGRHAARRPGDERDAGCLRAMRHRRGSGTFGAAGSRGFLAGLVALAIVVWSFSTTARAPNSTAPRPAARSLARLTVPFSTAMSHVDADPVSELRSRQLELPVRGALRRDLHDSFSDTRRWMHRHEAIDIMAPRSTPVL